MAGGSRGVASALTLCDMRIAAVYDIHGNLPALEAVLGEIRRAGVDLVVVGGDVLPGPFPSESLTALWSLPIPVRFIAGNGERDVLALREGRDVRGVPESALESMRWVAENLSSEEADALASWPPTERVEIAGLGAVLFCHATPRSDREIFTRITPEEALAPHFADVDADVVVCGHTHMPFERTVRGVRVVNAGSVGMPFGEPGAYWLLLTSGSRASAIDLRRTPYDVEQAARRIGATAYPDAEGFAARNVLEPPGEEAMLALFERAASAS